MFVIDGLVYVSQYINETQHHLLTKAIDEQPWQTSLSRRTQHYGYVYDYRAKRIDLSMHLGELPLWLQSIAAQLHNDGLIAEPPDQAIINEYEPGQGIADHIDCIPCFADTVFILSLAAPIVMNLKRNKQSIPIFLEPQSLLILQGEARYQWSHGIAHRKQDRINGMLMKRKRRLSVTFRKVEMEKSD